MVDDVDNLTAPTPPYIDDTAMSSAVQMEQEKPSEEKTKEKTKPVAAAKGSFTATHTMSKGEKFFEWGTYSGLNYWVNLISSVGFTDWFKHGWLKNEQGLKTPGNKTLRIDKLSEWLAKHMPGNKPYEKKLDFALKTFNYLALTSGGTALVIPIKMMEERKRKIVHWINEKFGVDQTAADGRKLTADEIYIEKEQPKNSWFNVLARRALGMVSVAASGHLIDHTFKTPTESGDQVVSDFMMKGPDKKGGVNRLLTSGYVPRGKFLATNERTQSMMGLAVLDSIFTKLTAFIMFVTNGAKKQQAPKEIELCASTAETPAVAATSPETQVSPQIDRSGLKARKPQAVSSFVELAAQKNNALAVAP